MDDSEETRNYKWTNCMTENTRIQANWTIKQWPNTDYIVSRIADFPVSMEKFQLRFFLVPYKESVIIRDIPCVTEWYSLWVELVRHELITNILLHVEVVVEALIRNDEPPPRDYIKARDMYCKDGQVLLQNASDDPTATDKKEVFKRFIRMKGWKVVADECGLINRTYEGDAPPLWYKRKATEIEIDFVLATKELSLLVEKLDEELTFH